MVSGRWWVSALLALLVGCSVVADVRERTLEPPSFGGGGAGLADGGSGGSGGAPECIEDQTCYDGPALTRTIGACEDGIAVCTDGMLGACEDQTLPAIEDCDPTTDLDCNGVMGCQGEHQCSQRFGDAGSQIARAVAHDSQDNLIVAGIFEGVVNFGEHQLVSNGAHDIFVIKLSPQCEVLWARQLGNGFDQALEPTRVAVDADDNVVLAGTFYGTLTWGDDTMVSANTDGYVVELTSDGTPRWARQIGGPGTDRVRGIDVDPVTRDVFFAGWAQQDVTIDGVFHDNPTPGIQMFVGRLTAAGGERVWSNAYYGDSGVYAGDVKLLPDGDAVVAGYLDGDASLGGPTLQLMGGRTVSVARYSAQGTYQASNVLGTGGTSVGQRLAIGPGGEIFVAIRIGNAGSVALGTTSFNTDNTAVLVAELDNDLAGVRGRLFDGSSLVTGLAIDDDGNVALSLFYDAPIDFGTGLQPTPQDNDIAFLKLTPTLDTTLWLWTAGAAGDDNANAISLDGHGRVAVAGEFFDMIELGGEALVSAGGQDIFVARFEP